jgi:SAM-dependent methyltransferase
MPVSDAEAIRQRARQDWGARAARYAESAADQTARLAELLVDAVDIHSGDAVLDVATGPGVVAVEAARRVGPARRVLATDRVPGWADQVAARAAAAGLTNVEFQEMDAERLVLPDRAFDVVLCQLGLMLVPDPDRALREMHRVLRVGGRLGVAVWSTLDRVAVFRVGTQALRRFMPPPPPGAPGPLRLSAPGLVEGLVAAAGFDDVRASRPTLEFEIADPDELWRFRVADGPPAVRQAIDALAPAERERVRAEYLAELEGYRRGGRIVLPNEAIVVTARRGSA